VVNGQNEMEIDNLLSCSIKDYLYGLCKLRSTIGGSQFNCHDRILSYEAYSTITYTLFYNKEPLKFDDVSYIYMTSHNAN